VVDHLALHDDVGLGERGVDVLRAQPPVHDPVRAQRLVDERRALLQRGRRVGHHGQRLVLDDDLLGGVGDGVLALPEHDRHRLADVVDLAAGQRPVLGVVHVDSGGDPGHGQRRLEVGEVLAGEDGAHVPGRPRRLRVESSPASALSAGR
jgi:hypothetical protein